MHLRTRKFWAFHYAHPKVYDWFKQFTFEVIAREHKHYSGTAIMNRIRWHVDTMTKADTFKLNDHLTPYYTRLFMRDYIMHGQFFRPRASEADKMFDDPKQDGKFWPEGKRHG